MPFPFTLLTPTQHQHQDRRLSSASENGPPDGESSKTRSTTSSAALTERQTRMEEKSTGPSLFGRLLGLTRDFAEHVRFAESAPPVHGSGTVHGRVEKPRTVGTVDTTRTAESRVSVLARVPEEVTELVRDNDPYTYFPNQQHLYQERKYTVWNTVEIDDPTDAQRKQAEQSSTKRVIIPIKDLTPEQQKQFCSTWPQACDKCGSMHNRICGSCGRMVTTCQNCKCDTEPYSTPLTSPDSSPVGARPYRHRLPAQLDGASSSVDNGYQSEDEKPTNELELALDSSFETLHTHPKTFVTPLRRADDVADGSPSSRLYDDDPSEDATPPAPATPAKRSSALPFPFARQLPTTPSRHPSVLLTHCESNVSPRQRRLMAGGPASPDRFVPSRASTPTKEALNLMRTGGQTPYGQTGTADPFAPAVRRTIRMAEQYATLRSPGPAIRQVGTTPTRVQDAQPADTRTASTGTIWTVGGLAVTDGVASTTDGRGGRVTSGTSAPHYGADFVRKRSQTDEHVTHGRRLALAMDIRQAGRMVEQPSSPMSPSSPISPVLSDDGASRRMLWKDGKWESPVALSPTKPKLKKRKEIPIVPYRVLDAPALRDDYYCSLLAFSHTLSCLAVGLGPHVYLWSESRGTTPTNIPDSLTVPHGSSHVTSLSFSSTSGGSAILAIGRADGRITLWSPLDRDPRFDSEQPAPVSHVCFRPTTHRRKSIRDPSLCVDTEELLVGDEVGNVYLYSIEWPTQSQRDLFDWHGSMTLLARISCHTQQICGIAWNTTGELFATGGNDNQLFLFETKKVLRHKPPTPSSQNPPSIRVRNGNHASALQGQPAVLLLPAGSHTQSFTLNAACKAIAFAPWQPTLLACGGGSNDRCLHFFHALSGSKLATIDCYAQVTSIVFNSRKREVAVTLGFAQPEHNVRVAVFGWPGCEVRLGVPWVGEERALWAVEFVSRREGGKGGKSSLVVATSDASIKFQEVWSGGGGGEGKGGIGLGSQILDGELGFGGEMIR